MLRKFHIERSVSCHHLLIGSAEVVRISAWTSDIVMSRTPIKSLDIKLSSWPPLVQSCFYLERFNHEMTSGSLYNKCECVLTIKNSQVKANKFERQIDSSGCDCWHQVFTSTLALRLCTDVCLSYTAWFAYSFPIASVPLFCNIKSIALVQGFLIISYKPGVIAELDQVGSIVQSCSKRRRPTLKNSHVKFLCLWQSLHCCLT
jgi:hypothetical protein